MNMFILGWVGHRHGQGLRAGLRLAGLGRPGRCPALITAVYTLAAGYWGVVMGDFLQGIVAVFAIVLVSLVGIVAAGGPARGHRAHRRAGPGAGGSTPFAFTGWTRRRLPRAVVADHAGHRRDRRLRHGHQHRLVRRGPAHPVGAGRCATRATACGPAARSRWCATASGPRRSWPSSPCCPNIADAADYELGWFRLGFELLPAGLVGVFFGAILAIHLSTISQPPEPGRALLHARPVPALPASPRPASARWSGSAAPRPSCC